jgi:hypothetical protein
MGMVGPTTGRRLSLTSATGSDPSLLGKVSAVGEATRVVVNASLLGFLSLRRRVRPQRVRKGWSPSGGKPQMGRAGGGAGMDLGTTPGVGSEYRNKASDERAEAQGSIGYRCGATHN